MNTIQPFELLRKEVLLDAPRAYTERHTVKHPNGKEYYRIIRQGTDAVVVLPITSDGQIILQQEHKYAADNDILWQFVAGGVDGRDPLEAAQTELLEETGYVSDQWNLIGSCYNNPNYSNNMRYFYIAENCTNTGQQHLEGAEQIQVMLMPDLQTAIKKLQEGPANQLAWSLIGAVLSNESLYNTYLS